MLARTARREPARDECIDKAVFGVQHGVPKISASTLVGIKGSPQYYEAFASAYAVCAADAPKPAMSIRNLEVFKALEQYYKDMGIAADPEDFKDTGDEFIFPFLR